MYSVDKGLIQRACNVAKSGGKHFGFFENNFARFSEELQKMYFQVTKKSIHMKHLLKLRKLL